MNEVNKQCCLTHGLSSQGFRRRADEAGRYVPNRQRSRLCRCLQTVVNDTVVSSACDFTVCLLIEKLSLSKMPLKNDPVVGELPSAPQTFSIAVRVCGLLLSNVWSLCLSAGWQSLIDDTIKNLHQVGGAVKDGVIVRQRFCLQK